MMTLVGSCSICSAPALNSCAMCGRLICRTHYDAATGLCTHCIQKRMDASGEGSQGNEYSEDFDE
jgi:hypothetical protein